MKLRTVLVLALMILPVVGFAQKKKKTSTPAVFGTAKYVYVKAEDGDMFNPRLLPEDRDAISNVVNALHDWGRYTVMPSPDGAELVFIVRKGRIGSEQAGITTGPRMGPNGGAGNGSQGAGPFGTQSADPNGTARQSGANVPGLSSNTDAGPPDDFLEVRMKEPGGDLSSPIWERTMSDGLDAPNVRLLDQLKRAVEKDYPQK